MMKSTFIAVLLIGITASAFQCNKKDNNRITCLRGKLIDAMCASYIVQITGGDYDPSLVESNWQDPQTGNSYSNVFAVTNFCELQGNIAPGDEFVFYFTDTSTFENCITCMALRATPAKANKIRLTNCGD
jgi:hypothetical protein